MSIKKSKQFYYYESALNKEEREFFKKDYENEMRERYNKPYYKPYFSGYHEKYKMKEIIKKRMAKKDEEEFKRNKRIKKNIKKLEEGNIDAVLNLSKDQYNFTPDDLNNIKKLVNEGKWFVKIKITPDDPFEADYFKYVALTNKSWNSIKLLLTNYTESEAVGGGTGSDAINEIITSDISEVSISRLERPKNIFNLSKRGQKNGRFFPYVNKSNIDMTRYQIIDNKDQLDLTKEHCVIYALRLLGVEKSYLGSIISLFEEGSYFPKKHFYSIANILKKNIILYSYKNDQRVDFVKYGNYEESYELALYEDHYFIYDSTEYTEYSIKHYRELENEPNNKDIVKMKKNKPERSKNANRLKSLQMINYMKNNEYFKYEDYISKLDNFVRISVDPLEVDLSNIAEEQEIFKYHDKKGRSKAIFFSDTESFVSDGNHSPLMMGIMKNTDKEPFISITDIRNNTNSGSCLFNCLDYCIKNSENDDIFIYFHNLKYDFNVIKNYLHIMDQGICEKAKQLYSVKILYKKRIITLLDSYKMAGFRLADFQKSFNLDKNLCKKEAIGYTYYNFDNYKERAKISDYIEHVKDCDKDTFIEEITFNKISNVNLDDGTFDSLDYYEHYLKYDVLVLCEGMKKMRDALYEITELDMYDYLTISSISDAYVKKNGAYDGVYGMKYNLRKFCSNGVIGGRVHVNEKYKKQIIKEEISDYDAVSLYPSAIVRLCRENGFPLGKAKILDTLDYNEIKKYNYSILKLKITKINKKQQMPFINFRNENGTMDYINETDGFITVIDIHQLDDYIKYHEIEYEIISGVYWNEGFNKKMGDLVEGLFKARLKYKKQENESLQLCCKLMMNSIYGRSIMKQSKEQINIVDEQNKDNFLWSNFSRIKDFEQLNNNQYKVYVDKIDDSLNYSHVGISILSYSKRIVNEVMDIANSNKINIYYTDTDSLHIKKNGLELLEQQYKITHGRELNGKNLGQFHTDFNLNKDDIECVNVVAYKSCFIGKKIYIDMLKGDNPTNGKKEYGQHIRIKGITSAGIKDKINQYDGDCFKIFENLANGEEEVFILNPHGSVLFEYNTNGVITKIKEFTRTL